MRPSNEDNLQDLYEKLIEHDDDRKNPKDIIGGIFFSIVIGLVIASIYVVLIISKDENVSLSFVGHRFLVALAISTVIIFLIRYFVKGFARIFSMIFMSVFFLFIIYLYIMTTLSGTLCMKNNGKWQKENPSDRNGDFVKKCIISENNYKNIFNKGYIYSNTKFEITK